MFWRMYVTKLKCLWHKRTFIFWNLFFPIVLATFVYFTVHDLEEKETFHTLHVGIVDEGNHRNYASMSLALRKAQYKNDVYMFDVTECSLSEASYMLHKNEIVGYIVVSEIDSFLVKSKGLSQTIIQSFVDQYKQYKRTCDRIKSMNPSYPMDELRLSGQLERSYIQVLPMVNKPNNTIIYYYALIAMACMFAAQFGISEVANIQADQSPVAARINCAPIRKIWLYLCSILACFTICFTMIVILILYMKYILKVGFDHRDLLLLGIGALGVLAGISIGAFLGIILKKKTPIKETILMGFVMFLSFLSGVLVVQVKYYVVKNIPILSYINPVNLIADSFYSLYYYNNYQRFLTNAIILLCLSILLGLASILVIRRKSYASL